MALLFHLFVKHIIFYGIEICLNNRLKGVKMNG
ncbi:hypothetical protein CLFO_43450 [Clostridium formicaceticum]|uniref:Uncharacterized protein n=1 Tax=Clostridium formicaceticum TaxID=1497 RepID=A0AAC9WI71_9CLOT|nr:hypothetical protein CLFO_43450 [Clostridium formicaceticum]